MNTNRHLSWILLCGVLGLALIGTSARAELVGTEAVIAPAPTSELRESIKAQVQRPELAREFQALGIDPEQAQARVDAMTDAEVQTLVGQLDVLPAGGALSNDQLLIVILLVVIIAILL
jgi:hypothetical protein